MAEYIEKKAVIEEIERMENKFTSVEFFAEDLTQAINSLPTKEVTPTEAKPEVDLEAEFKKWWNGTEGKINIEHTMYWYMEDCARHFYNLNPKHK